MLPEVHWYAEDLSCLRTSILFVWRIMLLQALGARLCHRDSSYSCVRHQTISEPLTRLAPDSRVDEPALQ